MTTSQIIALGFPLAAATAGAAVFLAKRFWLRNPEPEPIDPAQIDIGVAMTNIQKAMMELERANHAARQKTTG